MTAAEQPAQEGLAPSVLDLLQVDDIADPYPAYERMLAEGPVVSPDGLFSVLPTYDDCFAMLTEQTSSVQRENATLYQQVVAPQLAERDLDRDRARPFLFLDPPDHTRLRRLVSKAFTRRTVEALRPWVADLTEQMLDEAAERGTLELVSDVAHPLPVAVISEMLGVPHEERDTFAEWSHVLARSLDATLSVPEPEEAAHRQRAADEFRVFFTTLFEQRRRDPRDDLLSALVAVRDEGDRLTDDELLSTCMLLLIAGHETTVSLIGNGMLALLRHPVHQKRLGFDAGFAEAYVEEVLRHDPPVQMTMRVTGEDATVAGRHVPAGGILVLMLAAANRDPRQFRDPSRFDPTRRDASRHLSFSSGIHFCLGAPLARMEAQVVLPALARRLRDPQVGNGGLAYKDNIVLRGLSRLPIAADITAG